MADLDDKLQSILEDWYPGTQYSEVIAHIKQAFEEAGYNNLPRITDATVYPEILKRAKGWMTGQEWYDRFEKELPSVLSMLSDESATTVALEAAKRAAGVEGSASLSTDQGQESP